ncbi:MAG: hypothetical protein K6T16_02815 [Candidatus Pacearchaeota archaeon]|nr:hypothetical protein [Candidatus Pacearchaeota archaeon]
MPELITELGHYGESKILFDFRGYLKNKKSKEMMAIIWVNRTEIPMTSKMHNLRGICLGYIIYPSKEDLKINNIGDFYFYGTFDDLEINYNGNCPFRNLDLKEFRDRHIQKTPKDSIGSFFYKIPLKKMDLNCNKANLIPMIFERLKQNIKENYKNYSNLEKISLKNFPEERIARRFVGYPLDFQENAKTSGHLYQIKRRQKFK